ncbi:LPXTG cell wall anchor domain-containing protein [Streptococcus dysgalactiae]|uniref:Cell wall anchor protein n=1 Tax=Streptococcus iniae TaxID=1346 RepID=A0A3L8GL16_STRIN|nr:MULTISPECIES: LPXTG cell wall anchor domain-containing protein [Streptococcus]RLU58486.1 cell wall anchor protein [Streptococcus iniae]WCE87019.1 LPXTG cell wall anchor domain-containing protein [Streptococcus dysgalactiae]WCN27015.1 LPXTG cell wall anchor domain-containing protein [Streptococcus dysgalactiae]
MNQAKIITGLAVATLSTVAGNVHAEDVTSTPLTYEPQVSSETAKTPEVTESQVADAKTIADKATSDVNNQQNVVNDAQSQTNQSQNNVVSATTAVTDATVTAQQATPEAITKAQASVAEANTAVKTAETSLTTAQTEATQANTAVSNQTQVVAENQTNVDQAQTDANKAQEAVDTAKQAIDSTQANTNLADAEKAVVEKTTNVATAETNLTDAKQADAKLAEETTQAQSTVTQKELAVKDTQVLLNQVASEMSKEQVTTSLQNQAYYNQRDGAWAGYYGSNSFAATGCVPTSLAMVFSELARRGVTPTEVANYLYNNTNYFNKYFSGTSANGIVSASQHFGFVPTHLGSQSAIVEALQSGHYVVGAVQNNKFSPWGIQYSHEIVLRGYSNGNTYVYDPYNRANIGWYPVANLWNEQSRDAIDTSGVGVPFFKITTQKMAQLEAQKAQVQSSLNTAKDQLVKTQDVLRTLAATPLKTPEAQAKLNQAQEALALAQTDYAKAQEAIKLASQDLGVKEATLKNAQANLLSKQTALAESKATLLKSQEQLAELEATLVNAKNKVTDAQDKLTSVQMILGQKEAKLLALQNAPKILADAQAKLVTAKNDLANKIAILDEAVAKLKELEAIKADAQNQYHVVFEAYKAVRDAKEQAKLAESYNHIIAGGGEAIPVVDETGKITGYVDGSQKSVANEVTLALTSNGQAPLESPVNKENQNVTKSSQALPHTGEAGLSILSVLGVGLISTLGLTSLKKRRPH